MISKPQCLPIRPEPPTSAPWFRKNRDPWIPHQLPGDHADRRLSVFLHPHRLRRIAIVASNIVQRSRDWLQSPHKNLLAWWIPWIAVIAGLFAPVHVRTALWIVALSWMGTACILNAKRCGRTHCRYTGPYYLAMIAPVGVFGSGFVSAGIYAWLALAGVILLGSTLLWRATERAWGKYS
jgi:hypothetical protein